MLLALDIPTAKTLLVHGHWTVSRRKMSKSVGNVVDPFAIMSARGVDVVRFYLARVGGRFRDDVGASVSVGIADIKKYSDKLRRTRPQIGRTHN